MTIHCLLIAALVWTGTALAQSETSVLDQKKEAAQKAAEQAKADAAANAKKRAAKVAEEAKKAATDAKAKAKAKLTGAAAQKKPKKPKKTMTQKAKEAWQAAQAKGQKAIDAKKAKAQNALNGKKAEGQDAKKQLNQKADDAKKKAGDTQKSVEADANKAAEQVEQKPIVPLNMLRFTLGIGVVSISSAPDGPNGVETEFDAKGHAAIGVAYDLSAMQFAGIRPFIYYQYAPVDIVVRSGTRTFRGVWHGHQLGAEGMYSLSKRHAVTGALGITHTDTELNPSDLIAENAPKELLAGPIGFHASLGYEFAMMPSFHLGAKFAATFGTIGYSSMMVYSSFFL